MSSFDDQERPLAPEEMQWPRAGVYMGETGPMMHAHSHSESTHHVGECDLACKMGKRSHLHEHPHSMTSRIASYRSTRLAADIREARGLPPLPVPETLSTRRPQE